MQLPKWLMSLLSLFFVLIRALGQYVTMSVGHKMAKQEYRKSRLQRVQRRHFAFPPLYGAWYRRVTPGFTRHGERYVFLSTDIKV